MEFVFNEQQCDFVVSIDVVFGVVDLFGVVCVWVVGDVVFGCKVWQQLVNLGVIVLGVVEKFDGLGVSLVDLVVVFECFGCWCVFGLVIEFIVVVLILLVYDDWVECSYGLVFGEFIVIVVMLLWVLCVVDVDIVGLVLFVGDGSVIEGMLGDCYWFVDFSWWLYEVVVFGQVWWVLKDVVVCVYEFGVLVIVV